MPKKVDKIHDALMDDPDFKPQKGRTKDESAWAVAYFKKSMDMNDILKNINGEDAHTIALEVVKQLQKSNKEAAKAKGLVPQSGDEEHPGRWVKPETAAKKRKQKGTFFQQNQ